MGPSRTRTIAVVAVLLAVGLAGCAQVSEDADNDGVPTDLERQFGTDPQKADTDGDGLTDKEEITTYSSLGVDPLKPDTDGDGLDDREEVILFGTAPARSDSDRDGLLDDEEIERFAEWSCTTTAGNTSCRRTAGPDPLDPDTDDDRWPDGEEVDHWMARLDDPLTAGTFATQADVDGDGWVDGRDGDPFADLRLRVAVTGINLTREFGSGGANLTVALGIGSATRQVHVGQVPEGASSLDVNWTRDVDDGPATPARLQASAVLSAYHGHENGSRTFLRIQGNETSVVPQDHNLGDWELERGELRTTQGVDADLVYRLTTCRPGC